MLEFVLELEQHDKALSCLVYIIGILGFIPAVVTFIIRNKKEIKEKEDKIYHQIDEYYFKVNRLILDHPQLGVSWWQDKPTKKLSQEEVVQQTILFDMLTSLFEKTFLAYRDASDRQREAQWAGWQQFISDYCEKDSYYQWWQAVIRDQKGFDGVQYDSSFEAFMNKKIGSRKNIYQKLPEGV